MHLPWKKVKVKPRRISQFVSDHLLRSQKRRGASSLVVETGFPTSLVDLFIKNREKWKTPSKRKKPQPAAFDACSHSFSPEIPPGITSPSPRAPQNSPEIDEIVVENLVARSTGFVSDEREYASASEVRGGAGVSLLLLVSLKLFFVVILALGTKGLATGIAISAFLLISIEYACKHVPTASNPRFQSQAKGCSKNTIFEPLRPWRWTEVNPEPDHLLKRVDSRFENQERILDVEPNWVLVKHVPAVLNPQLQAKGPSKNKIFEPLRPWRPTEVTPAQDHLLKRVDSRFENQEQILDMEPRRGLVKHEHAEIQPEDKIIDEGSCDSRPKTGFDTRVMDKQDSNRESKKSTLNSKIKKLIPKKLRGMRKELEPPPCEPNKCSDNTSELSLSLLCNRADEYGAFDETSTIRCELVTKGDDERDRIEDGGKSWKHFILCIVALVGLIEGRVFSIVLVVLWFLVSKFDEKPVCGSRVVLML